MSEMTTEAPAMGRIIDFNRLSMWTPTPGVENKRARLSFGILDINPRISIFTNNPEDTIGKGIIPAPMNPETFFTFLMRLEMIAKGNPNAKEKIECFQGKERVKVSDLIFGKDEEGFVWVSVIAANRPNIKFVFEMSDWHTIQRGDGSKFTPAECSVLEALAKIQLLRNVYTNFFADVLKTPRPDYNASAGKRGSGEKKSDSFQKKDSADTSDFGFDDIKF